ncbi:Galactokinase-like protein [Operophtera brumata]|uniref:Galactokinase-like protein n=1 Tax=Operophtera brumata TaxID=104452 RepID=A0A0L7KPX2_OPEBR|nr:Galactokinase-like protein [Operophtera brumata]
MGYYRDGVDSQMTDAVPQGEAALLKQARDKFSSSYDRTPTVAAAAPGRVNLIGDHIDYCEGYVLPVALPFLTITVGAPNNTDQCRIISILATGEELQTSFPTPASSPLKPGSPAWANYVKGVVANFPGHKPRKTLAVSITSPCPFLSQSCAESEIVPEGRARVPRHAVRHHGPHQLTGSEYPQRCAQCQQAADRLGLPTLRGASIENLEDQIQRGAPADWQRVSSAPRQCHQAADRLGLPTLRGASIEDLEELKKQNCDELVLMRAKHVIEEISRTEEVAKRLKEKDLKRVRAYRTCHVQ